ncbi:class I SAM-dependent methyltransferase [Actibacterium sp. 188UL27-1]|uniref:class I SAM-dependent DNA methyltransferase n=1 Tax=Actibacterium sp. 188UL27-1 TaxID=2786961 RepID=UPI00351C62B5
MAETLQVYTDWADSYDADVGDRGYVTPTRIADAVLPWVTPAVTVLDYGCGTGLSGRALARAGLGPLHGTDITPAMVEVARQKKIYDRLWVGEPGTPPCAPGEYPVIIATGVVSLGAAPPDCFDLLLDALAPGGVLALSFNDPTLQDGRYDARLTARADDLEILFREHGPHLQESQMGADVLVLRRR